MNKELSIKKLGKSFVYAFNGFIKAFKAERNLKIHTIISILVIIFSFIFKISLYEWLMVLLLIGLVIAAELINTAIERLVDHVSLEKSTNAAFIKDVSASFVLILAIISFIIGLIIFIPKIINIWS